MTTTSPNDAYASSPMSRWMIPAGVLIGALIIAIATTLSSSSRQFQKSALRGNTLAGEWEEQVIPSDGVTLPFRWDDLGQRLIVAGVIDQEKFEEIYAGRGGLSEEERRLLYGNSSEMVRMTRQNAGFLLNLLWAFGLANNNPVLFQGPMMDSRYGGAQNFASTGGWTLSRGAAMDHYSAHRFISLTAEQQAMVERVSKGIYRPCCDNSTYFPDCNHGMAMLGLLELLAAQNIPEREMYRLALKVNSYWFPDTYVTVAQYLASKGIRWEIADPKELLGPDYSSGSGYRKILSQITEPARRGGGSCGV